VSKKEIHMTATFTANSNNPDGKWCQHFLDRHSDELGTFWSKPLARERAQGLNPENVKGWFEVVKRCVVDEEIWPEDCYGMDETGTTMGNHMKEHVVGQKGRKVHHRQGGGDRENVTAIITICTDGTTLRPTLIYKGKNIMKPWTDNNVSGASYVSVSK